MSYKSAMCILSIGLFAAICSLLGQATDAQTGETATSHKSFATMLYVPTTRPSGKNASKVILEFKNITASPLVVLAPAFPEPDWGVQSHELRSVEMPTTAKATASREASVELKVFFRLGTHNESFIGPHSDGSLPKPEVVGPGETKWYAVPLPATTGKYEIALETREDGGKRTIESTAKFEIE